MGELHAPALTEQISSIGPGCCLSKLWSDSRSSETGVSRMSEMPSKEGVSRKRLRLVFVRAPDPPVTLIRNGSDCLSVVKYAVLSVSFTATILTRQTHIQFMLQLILVAVVNPVLALAHRTASRPVASPVSVPKET